MDVQDLRIEIPWMTLLYKVTPALSHTSLANVILLFPAALSPHHLTRHVNTTSAHKVGEQDVQMHNTSTII